MTLPRPPHLLGVGGAHIDRRGQLSVDYVAAASNPGTMREEVGGGAFNALRNAAGRGVSASLISVRGGDTAGLLVEQAIGAAGIGDLSSVFVDRATPSYTALLDRHGDLIAGLADMDLYELAFPKLLRRRHTREAIAAADAVLCDANLPSVALDTVAETAAGAPLHAIAISPAKAVRLRSIAGRLATLFMSRAEAAALADLSLPGRDAELVSALRRRGLARGVVTNGGGPVVAFEQDHIFAVTPPAPRRLFDVTGAGDALAGAAVAAMMRGFAFPEAVREGMAAALLAIESRSTVPGTDQVAFAEALALVPSPVTMA